MSLLHKGVKMMGKKKRSFISLLPALALCALICAAMPSTALAAPGETGITDIWCWTELPDGTLSVTGCTYGTTAVGNLTLPAFLDTLPVTRIEDRAFFSHTGLTGITLPDGLESIGEEAFRSTGLTSITIPGSVTSVGAMTFMACYDLEIVEISDGSGAISIGSEAFASCSSLRSVTLSSRLESIGYQMFAHCVALENIDIPAGVLSIGALAFWNTGLTSIVIPNTVTNIDTSVFQYCQNMESATLPANSGFTGIPQGAFYGCGALNSVTIPPNVTSIGSSAFYETGFTSIDIPDTVTSIGNGAFQGCLSLTGVTLPDNAGFISIPENIFDGCEALGSIEIPAHVTSIEGGSFGNCPSLTAISVNPANTHFSSQGGVLYNMDKSALICYPGGLSGAFSIPDSVTAISEEAFSECNNLTEVTVPDSVTSIGDGAFCECENLSRAIIYSDSAVFGDYVFEDTAMPIYTATSDDGIYGHAGSTAQDYAQAHGILFHIIAGPASSYALTITAGTGGSITTGSSGNYAAGSEINIAATASANYSFNNWTSTGGGSFANANSATTTFTMPAGAAAITANFTYNGGSSGGGGGSTTSPQPVSSDSGTAAVAPAAGGSVSLGSDVNLNIPANALQGNDSAQVSIQKVDTPRPAPSGFMVVGTAYQFTVNGQDHYSFDKPVTLTFTFDPSKLAPGETPAVHYYDEEEGLWVNLGSTVSGNTITVTVDHFTHFAVLAAKAAAWPAQPPEQNTAVVLTDLSGHWAEKNIEKLIEMGAVSGYPDGAFKPDAGITRAEFTAMLVKAFKLQGEGDRVFADTAGHWAREVIATAAFCGIIGGYDQNSFGPDDPVTREQMAVMTVKAAKLSQATGELAFTDNKEISAWAADSVVTAVKDGILKGYRDSTFRPGGKATRAEAVTIIVNALK